MGTPRIIVARWSALAGLASALPFLALNMVVGERIEPLFSIIRPGVHTGPLEYPLLGFVLLLLPVGAAIALNPMLRPGQCARRRYPVANMLVAALLVAGFLVIAVAFGEEIYRCEVLRIHNCD